VDRATITSLAEAARTLDPVASTRYDAGSKQEVTVVGIMPTGGAGP
jgi:hypothetical protein